MARKKVDDGSPEYQKKYYLCMRISQIRQTLFDNNNRAFSDIVEINEQSLSQICSGKRNAGIDVVQKISEKMPELNANWLLTGRGTMLVAPSSSVNISSSPQATVNNGDMKVDLPVGIVDLLAGQQETINRLSKIIENLSYK